MIMDSTNCATDNDKTVQILTLKFWIDTNVISIIRFWKLLKNIDITNDSCAKNGHCIMFVENKKGIFAKFFNTICHSIIDANGNMPLEHG